MLTRIRRQGNKYEEVQRVEPEGILDAACADPTARYKGQNPVLRAMGGSI